MILVVCFVGVQCLVVKGNGVIQVVVVVVVVMLIEFNIVFVGKVQDIVEGGQVIEIEGFVGLVVFVGFVVGVVKSGVKLLFFCQVVGDLDIVFFFVLVW